MQLVYLNVNFILFEWFFAESNDAIGDYEDQLIEEEDRARDSLMGIENDPDAGPLLKQALKNSTPVKKAVKRKASDAVVEVAREMSESNKQMVELFGSLIAHIKKKDNENN